MVSFQKFALLNLALALGASSALACPHNQQQFICPGDPVVDSNGNPASVIGINAYEREASIRYQNVYISNATLPIDSLALGLGCIGSVCVNDAAMDTNGNPGKIIGLNPYRFEFAIQYTNVYISNAVLPLDQLSLGYGCHGDYCVGDKVADSNGQLAHIIGINYLKGLATISYENVYISNATLSLDSLALGLGCARGNCVNDRGTDSNGNMATVIAINPRNGQLVLQYDNVYISNAVIDPASFMSSEYCATYGDADRGVPSYVEPHGHSGWVSIYDSENSHGGFYFSTQRK